jgi:hypothetical protein
MGIPLSRVLLDFSAAKTGSTATQASSPAPVIPVCEPLDERARQLEEAYARGADEARLAADAEHEQTLAAAIARAEERHAAERARWTGEQADGIAARLIAAVETLETRIADVVGRVLNPFLASDVRSKSVQALAESIRALLSGASQPALRVSGPEDLLAALRERLGAGPLTIEWEPNGQVEVTVSADDSVIETEIQSWLDRFAGASR